MPLVLVVDDDPSIRDLLTTALEEDGFAVSTAANGREALRCIGVEEPALVLLDRRMPVMSGPELLATLRAADLTVPVVLMSADAPDAADGGAATADAILRKPFDLDDVRLVVKRLTARAA